MVYRRHSGVQDRLKAIPNQSNAKSDEGMYCIDYSEVCVSSAKKYISRKNTHTYNRNAMCYF